MTNQTMKQGQKSNRTKLWQQQPQPRTKTITTTLGNKLRTSKKHHRQAENHTSNPLHNVSEAKYNLSMGHFYFDKL